MTTIAPDVSYYQPPVNDSFNRRWLIFRCCDGSFNDPNCGHNAAWAKSALKAGKIDGWTAYVVYRPGWNSTTLAALDRMGLAGGHVMIDVESWGGEISGNHSADITALANQIAARIGRGNVWAYANRGDKAGIYPNAPSWLQLVVASYGGSKPAVANMVGWQYTNGIYQVEGLPSESAPFGACDHNVLYLTAESTESLPAKQIAPIGVDDMSYELIRDEQGGVYRVGGLFFVHVETAERWRIAEGSGNCVGNKTRQVNNRERDCLRADVVQNVSQLVTAFKA